MDEENGRGGRACEQGLEVGVKEHCRRYADGNVISSPPFRSRRFQCSFQYTHTQKPVYWEIQLARVNLMHTVRFMQLEALWAGAMISEVS
jgi:hypothetical protein